MTSLDAAHWKQRKFWAPKNWARSILLFLLSNFEESSEIGSSAAMQQLYVICFMTPLISILNLLLIEFDWIDMVYGTMIHDVP